MTPERNDIARLLEAMTGTTVLLVGDVVLDRFVEGCVERISPEAPVPVLRIEGRRTALGGAGNVMRNLAAVGARPWFVSAVGRDPAGAEVRQLVEALCVDGAEVAVEPAQRTTVKERFLSGGQQLLRADYEDLPLPVPATVDSLLDQAETRLPSVQALLLSDYGKGMLRHDRLTRLIAAARGRGLPVVVDPKGRDYSRYRGACYVTPNRRELQEASGHSIRDLEDVAPAARRIMDTCGIEGVLATLSEQGMMLVPHGGDPRHLPTEAQEVFDVTGAGDTVLAVFGAGLAAGADAIEAAQLANIAAGVVVGKHGTDVASPVEILRAAQTRRLHRAERKVTDTPTVVAHTRQWSDTGLTIGFTNGCFDLLHPGHVHLLQGARASCDRLIVGLNSDASVHRLKGNGRPVQTEAARAIVLASLECVDRVVIFAEDTPNRLIEAVRPDVLIKGAEYALDGVVGQDIVRRNGGRIVLVDLLEGYSTSATLKRMSD